MILNQLHTLDAVIFATQSTRLITLLLITAKAAESILLPFIFIMKVILRASKITGLFGQPGKQAQVTIVFVGFRPTGKMSQIK